MLVWWNLKIWLFLFRVLNTFVWKKPGGCHVAIGDWHLFQKCRLFHLAAASKPLSCSLRAQRQHLWWEVGGFEFPFVKGTNLSQPKETATVKFCVLALSGWNWLIVIVIGIWAFSYLHCCSIMMKRLPLTGISVPGGSNELFCLVFRSWYQLSRVALMSMSK